MKHKKLFNLICIASFILVSTSLLIGSPVASATSTPPEPDTVLLDHFDDSIAADYISGTMSYVDGPSGFGRAADFSGGNWGRYNLPGWYQWSSMYSPAGKQGTVELWVYPMQYGVGLVNFNWNNTTSYPRAHLAVRGGSKGE